MLHKLNKFYPLQLELIPMTLLAFIIYLTLSSYPTLPDRIPSHFNFQGFPDGWGNKNTLFIYPAVSAFTYLLITIISIAFALVRDPKSFINLPTRIKDSLSEVGAEKLQIILLRCLLAIKILILGLSTYLLFYNIEVAMNKASGIGYWPLLFIPAILAIIGFMLFKSFRMDLKNR